MNADKVIDFIRTSTLEEQCFLLTILADRALLIFNPGTKSLDNVTDVSLNGCVIQLTTEEEEDES